MPTKKVFSVKFYNTIIGEELKVKGVDPQGISKKIPYTPPNTLPVTVDFETEKDFIIINVYPPKDGDIEDAHYLAFWKSKKSRIIHTKEKKYWVLEIHIDPTIDRDDPHTTNVEVGTKQ